MYPGRWIAIVALLIGMTAIVAGQQAVTKPGQAVTASGTIEQVDVKHRLITLKLDDGTDRNVWAGPDVKRFDELKVGDKVNATFYESIVYEIRDPASGPPTVSGSTITGTTGSLPGGTAAKQTIMTVTVKDLDSTAGTITVITPDDRTIVRKVEDPEILRSVKVGDQIDIIMTRAMLVSVERVQK